MNSADTAASRARLAAWLIAHAAGPRLYTQAVAWAYYDGWQAGELAAAGRGA